MCFAALCMHNTGDTRKGNRPKKAEEPQERLMSSTVSLLEFGFPIVGARQKANHAC